MVQGGIQVTVCLITNNGLIVFEHAVLWSCVGGSWWGGTQPRVECFPVVLCSCNVASPWHAVSEKTNVI